MIELNFGLFHSGCGMSYLRYLSFKTLRHFHPNSKINLYVANQCRKKGYVWHREQQDFERYDGLDYVEKLKDLGVEIIKSDFFPDYAPNFQADMFRFWYLKNFGGFYMDTDQIILRSFETLPLDKELIYSKYANCQCGMYSPVGVIGAIKDSKIVKYAYKNITGYFNPNVYNCIGPFMFLDVLSKCDLSNAFNSPYHYFYPTLHSDRVGLIYDGSLKIPKDSYALHLFLGHPISQKFNKKYTEEFAKTSNDTVSRFLREGKII